LGVLVAGISVVVIIIAAAIASNSYLAIAVVAVNDLC